MGVDTTVTFPRDTQVETVAKAMGILAGLPTEEVQSHGIVFLTVPGARVKGAETIPTMATIHLTGHMVDGQDGHMAFWHFEHFGGPRLDMACTPFWVAVATALADLFGGKVDVSDCDDTAVDFERRKPSGLKWDLEDDANFDAMQRRLRRVRPLTEADMAKASRLWKVDFPRWSRPSSAVRLDSHGVAV